MQLEILTNEIKLPEASNLSWVFPVRLNRGQETDDILRFKVDTSDLHNWFKEAVGRYPAHEGSDKQVYEDILSNWDRVEPKLKQEFQKFLPVA